MYLWMKKEGFGLFLSKQAAKSIKSVVFVFTTAKNQKKKKINKIN